jgi:hypothetical protein
MTTSRIERLALEALVRGQEKVDAGRLRPESLESYIRGFTTGEPWSEVAAILARTRADAGLASSPPDDG